MGAAFASSSTVISPLFVFITTVCFPLIIFPSNFGGSGCAGIEEGEPAVVCPPGAPVAPFGNCTPRVQLTRRKARAKSGMMKRYGLFIGKHTSGPSPVRQATNRAKSVFFGLWITRIPRGSCAENRNQRNHLVLRSGVEMHLKIVSASSLAASGSMSD